jgi:hypothetical protein
MIISATSGCFEARIPLDAKLRCDSIRAIDAQQVARDRF